MFTDEPSSDPLVDPERLSDPPGDGPAADLRWSDEGADAASPCAVPAAAGPDDAPLAALLAAIVRQDEHALAALYRRLSGRVYALALRLTHNAATAEEVTEETFWQVWRQAPRFDAGRGPVEAWVLTMARSRALDALRGLARQPAYGAAASIDEQAERADAEAADPVEWLQATRQVDQLRAALEALDPPRRQLVALAFYRGLSHDEIARHTGLPLGTVKSHLRRALAALRGALPDDMAFSDT